MVYTTALVFGHGMPNLSEEESVVEMIGNFLSQLISSEKKQKQKPGRCAARRGSIDSCDETEKNLPYTDLHSGLEEEEEEAEARLFQRDMTRQIERCLSEAKGSTLPCEVLLLPRHMSARVGRDLVRSSAGEPCGLRGAFVNVYLEGSKPQDALKSLGSFSVEPSVTPTFELSVVFKVDDDGWPPLKHIFAGDDKVLKLRPEYRLVKRKLYSSASPVICDFC